MRTPPPPPTLPLPLSLWACPKVAGRGVVSVRSTRHGQQPSKQLSLLFEPDWERVSSNRQPSSVAAVTGWVRLAGNASL